MAMNFELAPPQKWLPPAEFCCPGLPFEIYAPAFLTFTIRVPRIRSPSEGVAQESGALPSAAGAVGAGLPLHEPRPGGVGGVGAAWFGCGLGLQAAQCLRGLRCSTGGCSDLAWLVRGLLDLRVIELIGWPALYLPDLGTGNRWA